MSVGILITYVDDLMTASTPGINALLMAKFKSIWACGEVSTTLVGNVVFLSTQITKVFYKSQFGFKLDQKAYTKDLIERHRMEESSPRKTIIQPDLHETGPTLEMPERMEDKLVMAEVKEAQSLAGELLWLSQRTRPDLAFAVSQAASHTTSTPLRSVRISKHILRYLVGSRDMCMFFLPPTELTPHKEWFAEKHATDPFLWSDSPNHLIAFTDASFASEGTKSFGAFVLSLGGSIVHWKCGKQSHSSYSTAESELLAVADGYVGSTSITALVEELMPQTHMQTMLAVDNAAAVALVSQTKAVSWRTRHLE